MRVITLASGSRGNCTLVSAGDRHFIVDCGISMRRINSHLSSLRLGFGDISAIFISHEHSDHISGLAMIHKYHKIPVFAPRSVANHLRYSIAGVEDCLHIMPSDDYLSFGDVKIRSFPTSHDTEESVGYRFEADKIFAMATDSGTVTEAMNCGLCGADAVLIESNHDEDMLRSGPYPYHLKRRILSDRGHLSNAACGELARTLADRGTAYIILGHLSRENNSPACAFNTVKKYLDGREVLLLVAPENEQLSLEIGGCVI